MIDVAHWCAKDIVFRFTSIDVDSVIRVNSVYAIARDNMVSLFLTAVSVAQVQFVRYDNFAHIVTISMLTNKQCVVLPHDIWCRIQTNTQMTSSSVVRLTLLFRCTLFAGSSRSKRTLLRALTSAQARYVLVVYSHDARC